MTSRSRSSMIRASSAHRKSARRRPFRSTGTPVYGQQVRVRPQQAQVRIEDGQAHSALQEQFMGEGVVLPPLGDQLQGRAEYEAAGRVPPCAVVQRDDAEADLQRAS